VSFFGADEFKRQAIRDFMDNPPKTLPELVSAYEADNPPPEELPTVAEVAHAEALNVSAEVDQGRHKYYMNLDPPARKSADRLETKGLPTSPEAERFVLGSILLDGDLFDTAAEGLRARDFSLGRNQVIFEAMASLRGLARSIEDLTVVEELGKRQQLQACGGVAYIASLSTGMPKLASIGECVRIVREKSQIRMLASVCQTVVNECSDPTRSSDEIISRAESAVMGVADATSTEMPLNTKEAVERHAGGLRALFDPRKGPEGIKTGYPGLDDLTSGFLPGELIVLAARTSMGKTAFALNIAQRVVSGFGTQPRQTVAFFSFEMFRESLIARLLVSEARVDFREYRLGNVYDDLAKRRKLHGALNSISNERLYIDDRRDLTLSGMGSTCRRMKKGNGLDLVIVDYLQLIPSNSKSESRTQEVAALSRGLKMMAGDLGVPVIALSQLRRESERSEHKRPQLSDLRESGAIEQDADTVMFLFREEVYKKDRADLKGKAELIVGKQRNGPTATTYLTYMAESMRFEDGRPYGPSAVREM